MALTRNIVQLVSGFAYILDGCRWTLNADGFGASEIKVGPLGAAGCAKECERRALTTKQINGATIRKSDGYCWCEVGMKSTSSSSIYNTCFLEGETML